MERQPFQSNDWTQPTTVEILYDVDLLLAGEGSTIIGDPITTTRVVVGIIKR